jgi:hypothetical protein
MVPLLFPHPETPRPWFFVQTHFSCDAVGRSFDSPLEAAPETLCRALLQRTTRRLLVAVDFYFGQLCSFSAQIKLVLMIPIRLLRIGRFASGFSRVSGG